MRFNDDTGRDTRIKFMTDGILLAEIQSDPLLRAYSALIIDEAHERSLNIDFLLGYLQTLLRKRADLKLLITSATIDTAAFSQAFGGARSSRFRAALAVEIRHRPVASVRSTEIRGSGPRPRLPVRATEDALIVSDAGDVLVFSRQSAINPKTPASCWKPPSAQLSR
jgi:ATP-dependent helicase HrpA